MSDFGAYCGRTLFHLLKKLVGSQYLEFLRILVPPEVLIQWSVSAKIPEVLNLNLTLIISKGSI